MSTAEGTPAGGSTARGLRAIGAAALSIEALVVILAAPAVISLQRGHVSGLAVGAILAAFVLLVIGAGSMRRTWGKAYGSVLQVVVLITGIFTWPMFVIGAIFGGLWIYYLRLWRLV